MGEIYEGAELTIRAALASAADQGFLHLRSKEQMSGFRINFGCPDGLDSTVTLQDPDLFEEWHQIEYHYNPIDSRAWTMQEAMLSRRMLSFGAGGIEWYCRSIVASETVDLSVLASNDQMRNFRLTQSMIPLHDTEVADLCSERWQHLVSAYSNRQLTNTGDRLAAIAGVAQRIQRLVPDEYLAGFWRSRIMEDLLWYCPRQYRVYPKSAPKTYGLRPRPAKEDRCAPSWSWASVQNAIMFVQQPHNFERRLTVDIKAELIRVRVKPVSPKAPLAALETGMLVIEGRLEAAIWVDDRREQIKITTQDAYLPAFPDTSDEAVDQASDKSTLWCIRIAEYSPGYPLGLLLTPIEPAGVYQRVGAFGNMD